ncbi:MAG TPA: PilZ domain-containing protein [Gammaproteobacteria bacterium]
MNEALPSSLPAADLAVLGHQVFCDDEIPVGWSAVQALPDDHELARMNARNEVVLRTLALVEEHDETHTEDAERAEMHRVEAKVNLVLELLADLVAAQHGALPARWVRFNSRGICWEADEPLPPDTLLRVVCYAAAAWPVPLKLHVRVASSDPGGAGFRICARIEGLSAGAANWLEKLVFRRHRRAVAQSRAAR